MGRVVDATPQEKEPKSIVEEAGLAPVPVWTVAENLAPHRDLNQILFRTW